MLASAQGYRPALVSAALVFMAGCAVSHAPRPPLQRARARNVILFIGDGLGITTYTAARLWKTGATGRLTIDTLPYTALCSTYSFDSLVAGSAAAATAILSGVKTRNKVIGEGPDALPGIKGRTDAGGHEGTPVMTIAEIAAQHGLATGVVTTSRITDATPAAVYAHVRHRDLEDDIAAQLLHPRLGGAPPDVILGGGREHFMSQDTADPEYPALRGARTDGRDLIAELRGHGYTYVWNRAQLDALDLKEGTKLLGLFEPAEMHFERQRDRDPGSEPSLAEMTALAIRTLSRHAAGYFLLVESELIDEALHANNVEAAIEETAMFDRAVERALQLTSPAETLLLVTADHSQALALAGNPALARRDASTEATEDAAATRRNLLGAGGTDISGRPYPVLSFATGPGALTPRPEYADRPALHPLRLATHSGEDVFAAARGPGADRVRGFITNTDLFSIMRQAYGF